MPRRSNPFQTLNTWLQDSLAGLDAVVTESAMIRDHAAKKETEVDILIEFKRGGIRYRTAIECRDHRRKADISWIRELTTKREDCRLDKIAAVHSMGFTAGAAELARGHNVSLYLLRDIPTDEVDSSLALKSFGTPLVSHSILRVDLGVVGLSDLDSSTEKQRDLFLADHKTTVGAYDLASRLFSDHMPAHDRLQEGHSADVNGTLPVKAGEYFVKCGERFLEVRQLFVSVRICKSTSLTGPTAQQLISVSDDAVAEIAAAQLPGPGGLWTWGVTVDIDSQKPDLFFAPPSSVNPLDIKMGLDVSYREKGSDEIKHARIPGKMVFLDESGKRIQLLEFRVGINRIHHDGPEGLGSENILGFYFSDRQRPIDLNRFIGEEVRRTGLPDIHPSMDEKKRASLRVDVAPDEAKPLLMKIRQHDEESFVRVNAVDTVLEYWLQSN